MRPQAKRAAAAGLAAALPLLASARASRLMHAWLMPMLTAAGAYLAAATPPPRRPASALASRLLRAWLRSPCCELLLWLCHAARPACRLG